MFVSHLNNLLLKTLLNETKFIQNSKKFKCSCLRNQLIFSRQSSVRNLNVSCLNHLFKSKTLYIFINIQSYFFNLSKLFRFSSWRTKAKKLSSSSGRRRRNLPEPDTSPEPKIRRHRKPKKFSFKSCSCFPQSSWPWRRNLSTSSPPFWITRSTEDYIWSNPSKIFNSVIIAKRSLVTYSSFDSFSRLWAFSYWIKFIFRSLVNAFVK